MENELYIWLRRALGNKGSTTVHISDMERIAGDEWLLEISAQAQRLNATVGPHAKDQRLALVTRD